MDFSLQTYDMARPPSPLWTMFSVFFLFFFQLSPLSKHFLYPDSPECRPCSWLGQRVWLFALRPQRPGQVHRVSAAGVQVAQTLHLIDSNIFLAAMRTFSSGVPASDIAPWRMERGWKGSTWQGSIELWSDNCKEGAMQVFILDNKGSLLFFVASIWLNKSIFILTWFLIKPNLMLSAMQIV